MENLKQILSILKKIFTINKNYLYSNGWGIAFFKLKPNIIDAIPKPCRIIDDHYGLYYPVDPNNITNNSDYYVHILTKAGKIVRNSIDGNIEILVRKKIESNNGSIVKYISQYINFDRIDFTSHLISNTNIVGKNISQYATKPSYLVNKSIVDIIPSYKGNVFFVDHYNKFIEIFPEIQKLHHNPDFVIDLVNKGLCVLPI